MCDLPEIEDSCDDDYDFLQDVARAGFGDMVLDTERNEKYYQGIRLAIDKIHARGDKAYVLDIGTGTGLLSMMSVKCGADFVTACEGFEPVADCAQKIIDANGMRGKIKIIKKRSTELVSSELFPDSSQKANVLVTEVFDTELIGEGAIQTFRHAHENLLTLDCLVVPTSARIYVQIVESPFVASWNKPKALPNLDGEILIQSPDSIIKSTGSFVAHDIQLSQIPKTAFRNLTDAIEVLFFDWSRLEGVPSHRNEVRKIMPIADGVSQAAFVWWDLQMSSEEDVTLSCAPFWAQPGNQTPESIPWRDHWMQSIYHLPSDIQLRAGEEFCLLANHNEYFLWFECCRTEKPVIDPICDTVFFNINCRTRMGQLNDSRRNKKFISWMEDEINQNSIILAISDGSLICLAAASLGAKKVYLLQENHLQRDVMELYREANNLSNVVIISDVNQVKNYEEITHVIAEPYFMSSILPWHNFYFGQILSQIRSKLNPNVKIVPRTAKIFALPVEFLDLQKIRKPIVSCEGFDVRLYDDLLRRASSIADEYIEAQPLWEYPGKSLGHPTEILRVDFTDFEHSQSRNGLFHIDVSGTCNGIALWIDWFLEKETPRNTVSGGPTSPICVGEKIAWDINSRQGVHLFFDEKTTNAGDKIAWKTVFDPKSKDILFKFVQNE